MKNVPPFQLATKTPISVSEFPDTVALRFYLQRISAGFPSPAHDHSHTSLDINDYLIENKAACFLFRVEGQSMMGFREQRNRNRS